MVKIFKDDGTKIIGGIIASTIEQIKFLGPIGGEVNVAARLEAAAEADGILMSYETYAHVQDIIEVEEKPSVKMKGINREIKVFSVLSRKNKKNLFNAKINLVKGKKQKNIQSKDEIEKIKKMILIIKKDLKILTEKISDK